MEYVRGSQLELRPEGADLLGTISHTFRQITSAVGHAHAKGVVNGNLDPYHILLTEAGQIKITNFGPNVATHVFPQLGSPRSIQILSNDATETKPMSIPIPYFISPEQILDRPVTAATDIYSVGVMMYKMMTGDFPFSRDLHGERLNLEQFFNAVLHGEPIPLRSLNPAIPVVWDDITTRCLCKDPSKRPSAADIYWALTLS